MYSTNKISLFERYCRSNVLHPWIHFISVWIIIAAASLAALILGFFNLGNFTVDDWTVASSPASKRQDAYYWAVDNSDTSKAFTQVGLPFRTQPVSLTSFIFLYELRNSEDIFTPYNIQAICEFEAVLLLHPQYSNFCLTQHAQGLDTICEDISQPIITPLFYPAPEQQASCDLLSYENVSSIRQFLLDSDYLFFFDKDLVDNPTANSPRTRSSISLAGPLGSDSTGGISFSKLLDIDSDPQWKYYSSFELDVKTELDHFLGIKHKFLRSGYFKSAYIGSEKQVKVRFYSFALDIHELKSLVFPDTFLLVFSITLVSICVYYHVKSGFITMLGLGAVVAGIPFGLFLYTGVFQIHYFNQVHITVLFIIVGIGSDNIFVFADAWKQSKHLWYKVHGLKNANEALVRNFFLTHDKAMEILIYRLIYSLRRSIASIFNTTLTTMAAFFATAISPVVPISAFGIYAALVVFSNFLCVYFLFPSIFVIHDLYFLKENEKASAVKTFNTKAALKDEAGQEEISEKLEEQTDASLEARFFTRIYLPIFRLRRRKQIALFCVVANVIFFVTFALQAFQLEVPSKIVGQYREGHMFQNIVDDNAQLYAGGAREEFEDVMLTFGITGIDRSGFSNFNPNGFRGKAVFDRTFDIAPAQNQLFLLDVCKNLRNLTCNSNSNGEPLPGCADKVTGLLIFPDSVNCVLEDFYLYESTLGNSLSDMLSLGDANPETFYSRFLNFSLALDNREFIGFFDGKLSFISIGFVATLKTGRPAHIKEPVLDLLYETLNSIEARAPMGLKTAFMSSFDMFFINTEKGMVRGLFQGLALSLPAAYVVLLIGTDNIILASFALFSIIGIVSCVLGSVRLMGWTLGIPECIAGIMVVGLSVDYSIHIGHMYSVAGKEGCTSREKRFEIAANRMGPTVLAGFVTTAGSASMMFFCQLAFFPKMATLICLTVTYSLEFALGFYLPLCLLIGPEGQAGRLLKHCRWYRAESDLKPADQAKMNEQL